MQNDYIRVEIDEDIAIVTIDRPPVNALNSSAYGELFEVFYAISKNDAVKVVILTGAGKKVFVAGADVKEFLDFDSETGMSYTKRNNYVREYIRKFNKPVICAINGWAFGGGCALALVCDIRIASQNAKFNLGEINMGILGGSQYIAQLAHFGTACKMVYSGETIGVETALRTGIVDEVVEADKLMERCADLAKKIASKSPLAVKFAKECMNEAQEGSLKDGLKYEEEVLSRLWGTNDAKEAVNAFLEKRNPVFIGK
ncbi:MAG: enoyl-CoA hydratase/isomerase family protein [Anaerolineales bacterium]|nr:enoyl-CoA hydratase/isomerase family protein [Anaerolineales bacterium]